MFPLMPFAWAEERMHNETTYQILPHARTGAGVLERDHIAWIHTITGRQLRRRRGHADRESRRPTNLSA